MEVDGFEDLMKKIESIGKVGDKIYNDALQKSAEPVLEDMQDTTVFKDKTGNLRKSFKISKVKKDKNGKYVWIGDVDGVAKYGWYIEHKTPFMRPAFIKNKTKIFQIIKEELAEGLINE